MKPPASAAGLQQDDILLQVNGIAIHNNDDLALTVRKHHPGDVLSLQVLRPGSTNLLTLHLTLAAMPSNPPYAP